MKLEVLSWFKEGTISLIGRSVELIFRIILCLLPLGVYMVLLQKRKGASSTNTISVFTKDNSKFQHVFPGFILVSIDPDFLDRFISERKGSLQRWIMQNKYIISFLFMLMIVSLMVYSYLRGGY